MVDEFNLDNYALGTDEGSGELVLEKTETPQTPTQTPIAPVEPQQADKFSNLEQSINNLMATQQRQSNAISTLIQALMTQQQSQPQEVDQEVLSDVFTDPDKGKNFLNTLEKSIERIVDSKLTPLQGQLQPMVQQTSLKAELDQLAGSVPDLPLYAQGMHQVLGINPNLSFQQAYVMAKQFGWKTEPQQTQPNQQQTQTNVADINQRRNLPPKLESSNATLKSQEIKSVRDAMEAALEQLGA